MATWDAYDYYNLCEVCKTATYAETVCSEKCETIYNSPDNKFTRELQIALITAKKNKRIAKQTQRILKFVQTYAPVYTPTEDSVCFYWVNHKSRGDKEDFLGRWQKGKCMCFGRIIYANCNWAESLLQLEQLYFDKKVNLAYHIRDQNNNILSWYDFLYHAIKSLAHSDEQFQLDKATPVLFGKMHHYRFSWGLQP
ncbi:hypothetical protein ACFQZE_07205 [Paenibacillus sp. GCM10027627]|uniref:hypothetical protein n=1 Tax=unclassified Paenibacillus TaxID=185978 RepID=UPI003633848A